MTIFRPFCQVLSVHNRIYAGFILSSLRIVMEIDSPQLCTIFNVA